MGVNAAFGVTAAFFSVVVLGADEHAKFTFDDAIVLVGILDHAPANLGVFLKRLVAAVNHYAGKAFVDAFLAKIERIAVVEMDGDGDIGGADGGFNEFLEINGAGVLAGAFGNLEHDGRLFLFASLDDGLEEFHVVDVERAQGVFAFEGFGEQVFCMCQWHKGMARRGIAGSLTRHKTDIRKGSGKGKKNFSVGHATQIRDGVGGDSAKGREALGVGTEVPPVGSQNRRKRHRLYCFRLRRSQCCLRLLPKGAVGKTAFPKGRRAG
jgi:hypothetical protein